eukprot:CAMPEP_0197004122 /NCGR_PEP_ID=MMETSP1380-20130617/18960_1 /TAXON_ID=5936 /ORGANISM="Euplotes crassus, Strain CT5" /LENGTH=48 /DNA_ID= /DNA_START= /DNA_END= /DNA_ORIENTATION=
MPYLKAIEEKYVNTEKILFQEDLDFNAYCKDERKYFEEAKKQYEEYQD